MKNLWREIVQFKWLATYVTAMNLGFVIGYWMTGNLTASLMGIVPTVITGYIAVASWRKP